MIRNLGQVAAIYIGSSQPTNTNLIWLDNTVVPYAFRAYDGSTWSELATRDWVKMFVDGWLVSLPPSTQAGDTDYLLINSNNVNYKITVKEFVKSAVGNPLDFKGVIRTDADFPNPANCEAGDMYVIITSPAGGTVTDPYSGQVFEDTEKIVWDEVTKSWASLGKIEINVDLSTDYSATNVTINSSAGKGTTINAASTSLAGVMLPQQVKFLAYLSNGSTVPGEPSELDPDTPAHKHNYGDILNRLISQPEMGDSTYHPMSQKATTDALNLKFDKASVLQVSGAATDKVMSQKAVTDALKTLSDDFNNKLTNYLPLAGGTMTGVILMNNNVVIQSKNSSGTAKRLIGKGSDNVTYIGDTDGHTFLYSDAADISHVRNGTSYRIWDSYNLTSPLLYASGTTATPTTVYNRNLEVNGSQWTFLSATNAATTSIYAPTAAGTSGQVLTSTGGIPTWSNISSVGDSRYVLKSGDTMTGNLTMNGGWLAFSNNDWTNEGGVYKEVEGSLKVWRVSTDAENKPSAYGSVLQINSRSGHWNTQLWIDQTNTAGNNGKLRYRSTKTYSSVEWNNWTVLATEPYVSSNYLPLTGGTLSGNLTINTAGSTTFVINNNDTNGSETFMRVLRKGTASAAIGFMDSLGAYIYNYNSNKYLFIDNDGYARVGTTSGSTRLALITDIPTVSGYLPLSGGTLTGALTMSSRRNNVVVDVVGGAGNSWDEGAGALSIQVPNDPGQTPLILARRSGAAINTTVATERLLSMELLDTGHSFIIGMSGSEALRLDWTSGKAGTGKLFGKTIATTDQIPSIPSISISNSGSGNAVTAITASGHTLTVTKGATYLTSSSLSGYATQSWVTSQGYLTSSSIYAPTAAGTSGQVLTSTGGIPTWSNISSVGDSRYVLKSGDTMTGNLTMNGGWLAFSNNDWTNEGGVYKEVEGSLKVWRVSTDAENKPSAYGSVLQINSRSGHWNTQLWIDQTNTAGNNGKLRYRSTKTYSSVEWNNWTVLATEPYVSSNYLPLTGGTLSGNLTINTAGSTTFVINNNDTNGSETFMRVLRKGTASAAIGFMDSLGAYIYNYNSNKYLFIDNDGYARVGTTSGSTRLALITDIPTVSGYLPLSGGTLTGALTMSSRRNNVVVDVVGGAGNSWDEGAGALSIQVPNDPGQTPLILARRSGAAINTTVATERLLSMELLDTGHSFIIGMSGSEALRLDWTSGKAGTGKLFGKTIATTDQIPSIPSISISNSGSGNAVTAITASGHTLTVTKGATYLTSSSLSGYATQSWVTSQGYLTSSSLSGYATQEWVNSQNFVKSTSTKKVTDIQVVDALPATQASGVLYLVVK